MLDAWVHGKLASEEVVARLFQQPRFDPDFVLRELQRSCERMQFVASSIPDYLRRIRAHGVTVMIATDNVDTFSRWTVPGMQLHTLVDGWLNSSDLGCVKSATDTRGQSLFFGPFLQANHIGPQESLLIDDNDESFGVLMRHFGIDYISVAPGTGVIAELERILTALDAEK